MYMYACIQALIGGAIQKRWYGKTCIGKTHTNISCTPPFEHIIIAQYKKEVI